MDNQYNFNDIARLPAPSDNVAIAACRLEANSELDCNGESFKLSHTILEGHRFAINQIPVGEALLSWGLPFGFAISQIQPGDYVCNQKMIDSLSLRHLDFNLP
ncbi:MAG: altronate hydrolase, partial [Candidatus Poribacteria bacterium]|nr:altronate hydrolase [Candidatus Poribacteria bacterium]